MRRRLIGFFLLFNAGIFLIASLINFKSTFDETIPNYIFSLFFATLFTSPPSLLSLKIIIDNYDKHHWHTNIVNTSFSCFLGLIYSGFFLILLLEFAKMPPTFSLFIVILGMISGSLLGWFASTISFVSLGISLFLGLVFREISSYPLPITVRSVFLFNILIISGILGWYAFFGKISEMNRNNVSNIKSNNATLIDLLELAKNKQKALSKAEIMNELKLDISTVDNLLKDAEINQLCSVQLDGENGIIKYNFDV